jgi:hypothetical protein
MQRTEIRVGQRIIGMQVIGPRLPVPSHQAAVVQVRETGVECLGGGEGPLAGSLAGSARRRIHWSISTRAGIWHAANTC